MILPRKLFKTRWVNVTFYPRFEIYYENIAGVPCLSLGYLRLLGQKALNRKLKEIKNEKS